MPAWDNTENQKSSGLLTLIAIYSLAGCLSLILVAQRYELFHFFFDERSLQSAIVGVILTLAISPLFSFTRFSFGWAVGFNLYAVAIGYVWLSFFSRFPYDHNLARISVVTSIGAFLLPALLVTGWTKQTLPFLSHSAHTRVLLIILITGIFTLGACATYGFRIVGLDEIYANRAELNYPTALNYLLNICVSSLLPYAFACYIMKQRYWMAGFTATLVLLFYPVTFSKLVLAAPFWLVFLTILSHRFQARSSTILALLLPTLVGLAAFYLDGSRKIFGIINFRMIAIPSSAIDLYFDFFSNHSLTGFCQISFLKNYFGCPYSDQLSVVMQNAYGLGNVNASMIATEGIASVGLEFAPISVFVCGLIIAIGNKCSGQLPERFILISSAVLVQSLINVALTTTLLTYGAVILFLLWWITPRDLDPTLASLDNV